MEKSIEFSEHVNKSNINNEAHAETTSACASVALLENCNIFTTILERYGIKEMDIRTYSPLTLAYIGDGIYDLIIRSIVVGKGNTKASQLHRHTSHLVKAHTQSEMMKFLLPIMTEEEETYYRRGRNAKSPTMAKNASMGDYRRATGFEALMGYLYLTNQFSRMLDLVDVGLEGIRQEELHEKGKMK